MRLKSLAFVGTLLFVASLMPTGAAPFALAEAQAAEVRFVKHDADGAGDGSSWADAFADLQDALDAAQPGDEIWVAQGTYHPTSLHGMEPQEWEGDVHERYRHFRMVNGVGIYGGFDGTETERGQRDWAANETVLSGAVAPGVHVYHLFLHPADYELDETAVLDGFTVQGGKALGAPTVRKSGGGMLNIGASPTLRNCVFKDNEADEWGGAMFNRDGASPVIENCEFVGNRAAWGGAIMSAYGSPSVTIADTVFRENYGGWGGAVFSYQSASTTITDSAFLDNEAGLYGGGIFTQFASATASNTLFSGNTAGADGGAANNTNGGLTVVACEFVENQAAWGGAISSSNTGAVVVNCVFAGNAAIGSEHSDGDGGAIWIRAASSYVVNSLFTGNTAADNGGAVFSRLAASPEFVNCTFSANSANLRGGAVFSNVTRANDISNTILWGNDAGESGKEIYIGEGSIPPNFRHNLIAGSGGSGEGWDEEALGDRDFGGNIDQAPQFLDAEEGVFRLLETSPAIDAGDDDALPGRWDLVDWARDVAKNDLDGNPRVSGEAVDMGAYEFKSPSWTLSILEPAGEGGTEPGVGEHEFPGLEWAEVTAFPGGEWDLDRWLLDGEPFGADNPISIEPPPEGGTRTLQPVFERGGTPWSLDIRRPVGEGTTEPEIGTHQFPGLEWAEVTAFPGGEWDLDHWLLDGEPFGADNPVSIEPPPEGGTRTLQPVFERGGTPWSLDIRRPVGEGTTEPPIGEHGYGAGEHATVTALPEAGWRLDHWLLNGDEAGALSPIGVEPALGGGKHTLQPVFVFVGTSWTLEIRRPVGEGTTEPEIGTHQFPGLEWAEVTAFPGGEWDLDRWLLDGEPFGADNPISIEPPPAGGTRTLQPVFWPQPDSWTLEVLPPVGGGSTAPSTGEHEIPAGESAEATAFPGLEWDFGHWLLDGEPFGSEASVEVPAAAAGETLALQAVFVDSGPPEATIVTPAPGAIHAPKDTLVAIEVTAAGSGVDPASVVLHVAGVQVYAGDEDAVVTEGVGVCRRVAIEGGYRYLFKRGPGNPYAFGSQVQVAVWAQDQEGNELEPQPTLFSFDVAVRPFAPPVQLNSLPGVQGRPTVAKGPEGDLVAVWEQNSPEGSSIWAARLRPGAGQWAEPAPVLIRGGGLRISEAAYSDEGTLYVAWEGRGEQPGIYVAQSSDHGETWSEPMRLDASGEEPSEARSPAFIRGGGMRIHVAWQERRGGGAWDIHVAWFEDGAWTSANVTDDPGADQTQPALAGDGENVHVVWTDARNPEATDIWGASSNTEPAWAPYPVVTDADSNQSAPVLAPVDWGALGDLFPTRYVIAWEDDRNGTLDVFFFPSDTFFPGTTFSEKPPFAPAWETLFPNFPNESIAEAAINVVSDDAHDVRGAHQHSPVVQVHTFYPQPDQWAPVDGENGVAYPGPDNWAQERGENGVAYPGADQWARVYVAWVDERDGEDHPAVHFAEKAGAAPQFGLDTPVMPSADEQGPPALTTGDHSEPVVFWPEGGNLFCANGRHFPALGAPVAVDRDTGGEGTFATARGPLRIVVPPNAVDADVAIEVSEVVGAPPPPRGGIGAPFNLSPSGLRFREPITVEIPVEPAEMRGLTGPWRVYWYNEELGDWDPNFFEGEYLQDKGVIRFFPTHFTMFSAAGSSRGSGGSGGCSMSGASGAADVALLLLPHLAALGLAVRHRWRRKRRKGE